MIKNVNKTANKEKISCIETLVKKRRPPQDTYLVHGAVVPPSISPTLAASQTAGENWTQIVRHCLFFNNMADMPDLSHLTPEERAIIENVMQRQKQEEDTEKELMKWVPAEVCVEWFIRIFKLIEGLLFVASKQFIQWKE